MFDRGAIDEYARGGEKLRLAIKGLSREELLAIPKGDPSLGKWSIQQVVIHLMDSDLIAIDRLKRIIAMENPLLTGYDETLFAQKLRYDDQPAEDAVTILDMSFKMFGNVLRKLPDETFDRTGLHAERGSTTLGEYIVYMIKHMDHHLTFIHAKRKAMGKELQK